MKIKNPTAVLITVLIFVGIGYGRQKPDLSLGEKLQRAMDESLKNSGAVGVSAAVIFPDGEMWKGASGISHKGVPLTTEMLFEIASIEKHFQATLALKLTEEGLIALDDPLEKWLPSYPHTYPNIDGKITIRQLLNMTSGIDDFARNPKSPWRSGYQNINFEKIWTLDEILHDLVGKPNFNPGYACAYSSTNYLVLKQIIEKATRSKQPTLFEKRLLKLYRLDHTLADFSKPIPDNMPLAHGWLDVRGDGNVVDISGHSLNWIVSISPMLVYSTPGDMVRWIDTLFHKKTVLKDETLKAMLAFDGPVQNEPLMKGYGLGVVDINIGALMPKWAGVRCYGHLGSQIGYTTFVAYFPEHGFSMSMMFNRGCDGDTERAVSTVAGALFDVLFKSLGIRESVPKSSVSVMNGIQGQGSSSYFTSRDRPMQVFEEEVKFNNGETTLAGTLTLPDKSGIHPAVILLQGSGPVNRDEEAFGWKPFKIIADHLAQQGVAVLRYDSRGTGGSSGEAYQYTISDVADDVLEGIRYLKSRRNIDAGQIGLLGHSQGGIVAPLVASRSKDVAFIICLSGTGFPGEKVSLLQNASIARAEGASESQIKVLLQSHQQFFQLLRRNAGIEELKAGAKSIVESSTAWGKKEHQSYFKDESDRDSKVQCVLKACASPWFRFFIDYDPRPALEKIECPILLIFGELDMQVPAEENLKAMVSALHKKDNRRVTVKRFPRANHIFQEANTGSPDEYDKLEKKFLAGFLEFISNWILEQNKK